MHWRKFGGRGSMDSWTSPVFALRGFRTAYDCFCQKHPGIVLISSI